MMSYRIVPIAGSESIRQRVLYGIAMALGPRSVPEWSLCVSPLLT